MKENLEQNLKPDAVSPDSMTQSAPSTTALPTSVISARVGRGFLIMDSSIWVAQMTGLARDLDPHELTGNDYEVNIDKNVLKKRKH